MYIFRINVKGNVLLMEYICMYVCLQCCIDDDFDMVKTLVRLGANVDQQDKEGWTPLHAASSCGNTHIVR